MQSRSRPGPADDRVDPTGPARRSPSWTRRRGISARDREGNEPWARLREHLTERYDLGIRSERRWEHPALDDVVNLPLLLRQASALVDRDVREILAGGRTPLDPIGFDVLRRLREKPSAAVHLSQYTRLSPPRVSEIATRLVDLGLAAREVSHRDLRVHTIRCTEAGLDLLEELEDEIAGLAAQLLDVYGLDEQDTLLALIGVLAEEA